MKIDETNKQIIEHLIKGLTRKEIADKVSISGYSVKKRIAKMLKETGTKNNVELTHWFKENCKLEV